MNEASQAVHGSNSNVGQEEAEVQLETDTKDRVSLTTKSSKEKVGVRKDCYGKKKKEKREKISSVPRLRIKFAESMPTSARHQKKCGISSRLAKVCLHPCGSSAESSPAPCSVTQTPEAEKRKLKKPAEEEQTGEAGE